MLNCWGLELVSVKLTMISQGRQFRIVSGGWKDRVNSGMNSMKLPDNNFPCRMQVVCNVNYTVKYVTCGSSTHFGFITYCIACTKCKKETST